MEQGEFLLRMSIIKYEALQDPDIKGIKRWWISTLETSAGKRHYQYKALFRKYYPGLVGLIESLLPNFSPTYILHQLVTGQVYTCANCGAPTKNFVACNPHKGHTEFCSNHCASTSPLHAERIKSTNLARYGVGSQFERPDFWNKTRQTKIKLYGADHHMRSADFLETFQENLFKTYGVRGTAQLPAVRAKMAETMARNFSNGHNMRDPAHLAQRKIKCLETRGYISASQDPKVIAKQIKTKSLWDSAKRESIKAKTRSTWAQKTKEELASIQLQKENTSMERYGEKHHSQVPEILAKMHASMSKRKHYVTSDKKLLSLQGYEPQAAALLEQQGFKVRCPNFSIDYFDSVKQKLRSYTPDLLATKNGKRYLIEVKSTYTALDHYGSFAEAALYAKYAVQENLAGYAVMLLMKKHWYIIRSLRDFKLLSQGKFNGKENRIKAS